MMEAAGGGSEVHCLHPPTPSGPKCQVHLTQTQLICFPFIILGFTDGDSPYHKYIKMATVVSGDSMPEYKKTIAYPPSPIKEMCTKKYIKIWFFFTNEGWYNRVFCEYSIILIIIVAGTLYRDLTSGTIKAMAMQIKRNSFLSPPV